MKTVKITTIPARGIPTSYKKNSDKSPYHLHWILFPSMWRGYEHPMLSPEFKFEKEYLINPSNPEWTDDGDIYDPEKENEEIHDPNKDKKDREFPTRENADEIFPDDEPDHKDDRTFYLKHDKINREMDNPCRLKF